MIRYGCLALALLVFVDAGAQGQIFRRRANQRRQPAQTQTQQQQQQRQQQQQARPTAPTRNQPGAQVLQAARKPSPATANRDQAAKQQPQQPQRQLTRGEQRRQARAARKNPNQANQQANQQANRNQLDPRRYGSQPVSPNARSVVDLTRPSALAATAQRLAVPRPAPARTTLPQQVDLARQASANKSPSVIQEQPSANPVQPRPAPSPALVGPDELETSSAGQPSVLSQRPPKAVSVPAAKKSPTPAQPSSEAGSSKTYSILQKQSSPPDSSSNDSATGKQAPASLKSILEPIG